MLSNFVWMFNSLIPRIKKYIHLENSSKNEQVIGINSNLSSRGRVMKTCP